MSSFAHNVQNLSAFLSVQQANMCVTIRDLHTFGHIVYLMNISEIYFQGFLQTQTINLILI